LPASARQRRDRCGTEEKHSYDEADRLIDTGVEYEAFGNQTKIPAADAGEHEITASFYADSQVAVQKQNGETTSYAYDPAGRTEETVSEGTTKATVVNHYPGPGEAISWTEEEEGKAWTRDVPGIDGALTATQHDSEAPVLQLHDLEGNIIATAAVSETETKVLTTYNPTEFGVPVNGAPPTRREARHRCVSRAAGRHAMGRLSCLRRWPRNTTGGSRRLRARRRSCWPPARSR
jgi:YD repeat-containing protein